MPRYVDVENISKLFNEKYNETKKLISDGDYFLDNLAEGFTEADRIIRAMPTVDVVEVKHGKWISARPSGGYDFYCSCCKEFAITYEDSNYREQYYLTDYCPNCGAKMDGKEEK